MNAPKPGDLLDNRYLIVRTLATGGFGQTYIAEDTRRPGNPVCVVKHLTPASSDSHFMANATRLFLTEAQTLERLGIHDQIPRLLAYFEEEQEFYLVQDWIDGYPLIDELQPGQRWSESKVCQMLQEVLSILQFVHSFGVIHRDIKPDNIIKRRQDNKLVLVDFGIVKQIRTQILTPGQINSNVTIAVGTPGYMPTEQGRGNPRPNSDIYALGIIGIQAVTGLNPSQFQEDSQTGEIIWQPWAQVSEELAAILGKMVRYHFKDRYQSATEALQALEPLLARFSLASLNSVATPSGQVVITSQPTQVSSQLGAVPVHEPLPTQVSSQPSAVPIQEPLPTQVSSQPGAVPIHEPLPTQVSSQPNAVPIQEPELAQDSLQVRVVPIHEPQPTGISEKFLETPHFEERSFLGSSVPEKDSQLNYMQLLRQAAILGTGNWLLAIFLISILGTVWLGTTFWLVISTGFIFGYFAKNSPSLEKYSFLGIALGSSVLTFLFLPRSIPFERVLQAGQAGLLVIVMLAIFSGALAFILVILFHLFEIIEK
ncbi:protein kinase domain-containing protein [Dendronalium sp. ChiSLP03b]|uniref:protein kinase domain-containing protein n=1 Tax=Dendronalium sp. ChiSLP03b TaxID=3075381 RepID=UPI002AD30848|nr:protein kinase [Dendronalium sp. ChiSLP03b]MDZ8205685.1 protein kinase [Dendronalium sp. ChiSLP03b]